MAPRPVLTVREPGGECAIRLFAPQVWAGPQEIGQYNRVGHQNAGAKKQASQAAAIADLRGRRPVKNASMGALIGAALLTGASGPAWAHHSHSMFDETQELSITGTVKNVAWVNPHGYLFLVVQNPDQTTTTWQIELSYLQNMMRHGILPTTFKEGDTVTVKLNPLRDGNPGGSFTGAVDTKGREYSLR
jgi:hypothetical protein